MKKYYCVCILICLFASCLKKDQYAAPSETLSGEIIDSITGQPLQTEQGNGVRIKLDELSWSSNPVPQYFAVKQDGTFFDDKLFSGYYRVTPVDGPFVPLIQIGDNGDTLVNRSELVTIKGSSQVNFTVEPFLEVTVLGEPVVNSDSSVSVTVKVSRGTNNIQYQFPVTDFYFFVSENQIMGNSNFDNRYSVQYSENNDALDKEITLTSKPLPANRKYFIRVGARTNDNIQKRYNYSAVIPL